MNALITPEQFEALLPLACQWAIEQEQRILDEGDALSSSELADARLVGLSHPEHVRILHVPEIPIPEHPALRQAAAVTQLISPLTRGLTLRYGIFIHHDCRSDRAIVRRVLLFLQMWP
jgi:hypothetical protein